MPWDRIPTSNDRFVAWDPYISKPYSAEWDGVETIWDDGRTSWDAGPTVIYLLTEDGEELLTELSCIIVLEQLGGSGVGTSWGDPITWWVE